MKRKAFVFYGGGAGLVQPESLIRGTRARENGVLPESGRARIASWETIAQHPRGSGTKESLCRASNPGKPDVKSRGILCFVQDVHCTGTERVLPLKESKKRSFPRPRGGQDAIRGKAFGGRTVFPSQVPRHGDGSFHPSAERVARLWAPPAPSRRASRGSAGGGFPGFADSTTWDRSAPAQ